MDPFDFLDFDIVIGIVRLIDPLDVVKLQCVSRSWKQVLGSNWLARLTLAWHFPNTTEAATIKNSNNSEDAAMAYRRCLYRVHMMRMGCPSKINHIMIDYVNISPDMYFGNWTRWDVIGGMAL